MAHTHTAALEEAVGPGPIKDTNMQINVSRHLIYDLKIICSYLNIANILSANRSEAIRTNGEQLAASFCILIGCNSCQSKIQQQIRKRIKCRKHDC